MSNDVIEILDDDENDDHHQQQQLERAIRESRQSFEREREREREHHNPKRRCSSTSRRTASSGGRSSCSSSGCSNKSDRQTVTVAAASSSKKKSSSSSTSNSSQHKSSSSMCIDLLRDSDDDDDDDDDLLKLVPSGLTKTPGHDPATKSTTTTATIDATATRAAVPSSMQMTRTIEILPPPPPPAVSSPESSSSSLNNRTHTCPSSQSGGRNNNSSLKPPPTYNCTAHQRYTSTSSGSSSASSGFSGAARVNPYNLPHTSRAVAAAAAAPPPTPPPPPPAAAPAAPTAAAMSRSTVIVDFPTLRQTSKVYDDLRPNLLLGLWKSARRLTLESRYMENFDQCISRLVALAVMADDYPIRSLAEYAYRGICIDGRYRGRMSDESKVKEFEKSIEKTGWIVPVDSTSVSSIRTKNNILPSDACSGTQPSTPTAATYPTTGKKFLTVAEACLVGIQEEILARWRRTHGQQQGQHQSYRQFPTDPTELTAVLAQRDMWVSLSDVIRLVDARLSKGCPSKLGRTSDDDNGVSYYKERTTKSAEFKQIEKLIQLPAKYTESPMGCIKKHVSKGDWLFELTTFGFRRATIVAQRSYPARAGYYRTSNLNKKDSTYGDLWLAVDSREGGGAMSRKTQHDMCNTLDQTGIPYFVGSLNIGDYALFLGNQLCPILVERKSVQDVAMSIYDGRWQSQKKRMYHGQFVFGYGKCRLVYIIEGNLSQQQVSHGYVGSRKFQVDQERFEKEIKELEEEGFEVIRTPSVDSSMRQLAKWAQKISNDVENGTLKPTLTYNEFVEEVKKIQPDVDFSRLAKYQAQKEKEETETRKQAIVDRNEKREANIICLLDDDDDVCTEEYSHCRRHKSSDKKSDEAGLGESSRKRKISEDTVIMLDDDDGDNKKQATPARNTQSVISDDRNIKRNRFGIDNRRRSPMTADPIRTSRTANEVTHVAGEGFSQSARTNNCIQRPRSDPTSDCQMKAELQEGKTPTEEGASSTVDYSKWTQKRLQEECEAFGLTKSGNKQELIKKLNGPKPPPTWVERKKQGLYVPARLDTNSTANLVAIQILQDSCTEDDFPGGTKEEIYTLAESLEISKNPYSGGTTQTGPYLYDGWSSMKNLYESGDPPLVVKKKGGRYSLSVSSAIGGLPLSRELHRWSHQAGICRCEKLGYSYNL